MRKVIDSIINRKGVETYENGTMVYETWRNRRKHPKDHLRMATWSAFTARL